LGQKESLDRRSPQGNIRYKRGMKVFLSRGSNRKENIRKVLSLLFDERTLPHVDEILLKPNLTGMCIREANTHYEAVETVIEFISERFPWVSKILVGEGSGGAFWRGKSTWEVFNCMGYEKLKEFPKVSLINFDEGPHPLEVEVDTIHGKDKLSFYDIGKRFVISIALPKTHDVGVATGGLKNMMGLVHPSERIKIHGLLYDDVGEERYDYLDMVKRIHINLRNFLRKVIPDLVIIDGLYGMEGDGPVMGEPIFHGFALASWDPIAADSATFSLMGFEPKDVGYLFLLSKDGFGSLKFEWIGDPTEGLFKKYKPHRRIAEQLKWKELIGTL